MAFPGRRARLVPPLTNEPADSLTCVKTSPAVFSNTDGVKPVSAAQQPLPPAIAASRRLVREWKTMAAMVRYYCQDYHETTAGLCPECRELQDYATLRLDRCRFGAEKPTCANCPVHCYQRDRRDQMKTVMRHAGPRMLGQHPILSLRHWLDSFRKAPPLNHEAATPATF
jgi:hypothetical protein